MHTSWIGVMLRCFLMLLVLTSMVHGKAFLEDTSKKGKHDYYSEIRNQYQPIYDRQTYAANPKQFYSPQIDGQPIYIPAISGSEHINQYLDDYYKINGDYTQSWTLPPPPVTFNYDISSESNYYENGVTANSMVKNLLEEKYKDGVYSNYMLPTSPENLLEQESKKTAHNDIGHKDSGNKKNHIRKKKRPHSLPTESSYSTQYKIKTEIPEYSTVLIKAGDKKQKQKDKSPVLVKSDISTVDDYDEMDHISNFEQKEYTTDNDKQTKTKNQMDYSKNVKGEKLHKKDKKHQSVKRKNEPKSEHVSKSYAEDHTNSDLKLNKKGKQKESSKYSASKVKSSLSVSKNKPEIDSSIELSDYDYEPEIVDVVNEDDYEPEVIDVIDQRSEHDYEPEIVDVVNENDYEPEVVDVINKRSDHDYELEDVNELFNDDNQKDLDVKMSQTHLKTEDYDKGNSHIFSPKKDKLKKTNSAVHSKEKNGKPIKGEQQYNYESNKPNKYLVKDSVLDKTKLIKPEKNMQNSKDASKKIKNKMPDSYEQDFEDINKLSDDDYELETKDELADDYEPEVVEVVNKLADDYEPEVVEVVNKLADFETDVEDADISDIDLDPEVDVVENLESKPQTQLGNDETVILDSFTSEKDKAKPSKPVKTKPVKTKPVKTKPKPTKPKPTKPIKIKPDKIKSKPVKTEDHYDKSEIKSNLKEIQPPKIETKDKSKEKYVSTHIIKENEKDSFVDESIMESHTENPEEINSRDLLNHESDIRNEFEEFDGSGSQAIEMRRIPQFFKNVESIRNLTSINSNIWSLIFNPNAERNEPKRCVTRSNETGICKYVQQCEVPNIATSLEQLLNNACVIDDVFIGVCCPEFPVQTVKVHWDEMPSNSDKQSEDSFDHDDDCGIRSDDAKKTESWPWQAPLVSMSNGKIFCGGVIINDDYILTAAHCTTKIPKNQILVRLGQHDETSGDDFAVVEIKRHAQYNPRTMHNDIALLKLGKRISGDKHTGTVCLPEDDDDDDHEDEKAVLIGRKGRVGQSSKQTEWLKVMSNEDCEKKLDSKVPATLLCTDARDENERTCNLDSGAPLVVEDDGKYEVIGILSWNRNDCDERFPSTFSRVSKYVRWIQKHIV